MNLLPLGERKFFPYFTETKQLFCFNINSSKLMNCENKEKKMYLDITEEVIALSGTTNFLPHALQFKIIGH